MILAKKSGDPPQGVSGGSPDDFRRDNIAGPHGMLLNLQQFRKIHIGNYDFPSKSMYLSFICGIVLVLYGFGL